jgi:raffinose/stachyose/melibiose transport system substrate-binding protein
MIDEGYFLDLTGEPFLNAINPDIVALSQYNGKQYMLPLTLNGYALYINTDIYDEYGLSVPTTYEELIANCETLKAAGVTPFAFPFKDTGALGQNFERLLGGVVDHEPWLVSQAVSEGASFSGYPAYVDYVTKWYALSRYADTNPLSTDTDDCARMFANQEVAMVFNGTWGNSVYMSLNPDLHYEAVLPPTISGIDACTCGTVDIALALNAEGKNIEAAKTFLNYFVSDAVAQKFAEGDKNPTAVTAVQYVIPHLDAITAAIAAGRFSLIPTTYWPAGYRDELQVMLQQLLLDGDTGAFISSWDEMTVEFYTEE